ncbi:MAG: hypothetical protein AMXMBFR64_06890 [Myxococcales bacterium]
MNQTRTLRIATVVGLIVVVGAFYLLTLRPGHDWGGDFALYVMHARSIVEGTGYTDTPWIYNPDDPGLSPRAYPPVFPLLLAPVLAVTGVDLDALKIVPLLSLLASLLAIYALARQRTGHLRALAVAALFGLNPYVWHFSNGVKPDLTFVLFIYATFALWGAVQDRWQSGAAPGLAAAAGLTAYLAYGTRSVGMLLVAGMAAALLSRARRPRDLAVALVAFAVPAAIQAALISVVGSYGDVFVLSWDVILRNLETYPTVIAALFDNGRWEPPTLALTVATCLLALVGYARRVRESPSALEVFLPLYLGTVIIWPYYLARLLVPVIPALLLYAVEGADRLTRDRRPWLQAGLVALTLGSYASKYETVDMGPVQEGVMLPSSQQLFAFARAEGPPDAVWAFCKPRPLALLTGRRSISWTPKATDAEQWAALDGAGVRYVVIAVWSQRDMQELAPFVLRNRHRFRPVFQNEQLAVMQVLPPR